MRSRSEDRRRGRVLIAAAALGALLVLAALLATRDEGPPAGVGLSATTLRTLSPATALQTASVADMPGAHLAEKEPVPILMYHVIGRTRPGTPLKLLWVSPEDFKRHVAALKRAGYNAVTMRQVWLAWHHGRKLPRKPIVFSFDDGYRGQVTYALPMLQRFGWAGVLNLTLENLRDTGGTRAVQRMMRAGWEVASHTLTHPDLTTLGAADLRRELAGSRSRLRRLFKVPVSFFCYPGGKHNDAVIAAVRAAGYKAATTVQPGWSSPATPYTLPRVRVDGGMSAKALVQRVRDLRPAG